MIAGSNLDAQIGDDFASFWHDPLGYVMYAYPWGEPNTGLAGRDGPNEWQTTVLRDIGEKLKKQESIEGVFRALPAILEGIASGHGVGKSALIVWIIQWAMNTFTDCRGIVTANTETQLKTKTWPEMAKWHRLNIGRKFFTLTATSYFSNDPEHRETWRFDLVPWSEKNTEAFAGLHNQGKRIIVVFDEGSKIPDMIWETTEGALTDADTEIIWVVCGNPTQNTGRFKDCFELLAHRWSTWQVDSRTVPFTNKEQIAAWEKDYGEDSDFFRVRVRGVFPRAGAQQLIPTDIVDAAMEGEDAHATVYDPLVIGVDVARFGDDQSVVYPRKGKDARTHAPYKYRGLDTMALATRVVEIRSHFAADGVFIDGGGVGGGVVDRVRELKADCIEVQFGGKPDRVSLDGTHEKAYNKRAEMWLNLRTALRNGLKLPKDPELRKQLIQQTYEFRTIRGGDAIILTSKEAMKLDGLESPDIADALACTYAYPVVMNPDKVAGYVTARKKNQVQDYDPYAVGADLELMTRQEQVDMDFNFLRRQ